MSSPDLMQTVSRARHRHNTNKGRKFPPDPIVVEDSYLRGIAPVELLEPIGRRRPPMMLVPSVSRRAKSRARKEQ